jgi:hypothetical protein
MNLGVLVLVLDSELDSRRVSVAHHRVHRQGVQDRLFRVERLDVLVRRVLELSTPLDIAEAVRCAARSPVCVTIGHVEPTRVNASRKVLGAELVDQRSEDGQNLCAGSRPGRQCGPVHGQRKTMLVRPRFGIGRRGLGQPRSAPLQLVIRPPSLGLGVVEDMGRRLHRILGAWVLEQIFQQRAIIQLERGATC